MPVHRFDCTALAIHGQPAHRTCADGGYGAIDLNVLKEPVVLVDDVLLHSHLAMNWAVSFDRIKTVSFDKIPSHHKLSLQIDWNHCLALQLPCQWWSRFVQDTPYENARIIHCMRSHTNMYLQLLHIPR